MDEFNKKSPSTSMIKYKIPVYKSDLRDYINDEYEYAEYEPIDINECYNNLVKSLSSYIEDEYIDTIDMFIDGVKFQKNTNYGILRGMGADFTDLCESIVNNNESEFEDEDRDALFQALKELGCSNYVTNITPIDKNFIDMRYRVKDLKDKLKLANLSTVGKKDDLMNTVLENNLINASTILRADKEKICIIMNDIINIYVSDIQLHIKDYNKALISHIQELAIDDNYYFQNELRVAFSK